MGRRRIIDADKALEEQFGKLDMTYDKDIANYEAMVARGEEWMLHLPRTLPPLELERESDRFLQECLDSVK